MYQQHTSAKTSINQVPSLHRWYTRKIGPTVDRQQTIIDMGAGMYDTAGNYLRDRLSGVEYLPYDPYNRTLGENVEAMGALATRDCDVLCANVLNVIAEHECRAYVIALTANCTGKAYFTVYEGDGSGAGRKTTRGWQNNRKTITYQQELEAVFTHVERRGQVFVCWNDFTSVNGAGVAA